MQTDMQPPVRTSVLIPAYNGGPYIGEAIESVLNQTDPNFELIVADDGSTDGTQDIIRTYARRDPRVQFRQNPVNLGCVRNINSLILASHGEYIKVLIQDDALAPACLERFAAVLDSRRDVLLVTSYQRFIGDRTEIRKLPTLPAIGQLDGKLVQKHLLANGNWIGGETAVMMRRSSLSVGLFNPNWIWQVDQDLWLRILARGDLYVVPEVLTYPRIHDQQTTVTHDTGFTFIREELIQRRTAFMAPEIYGRYTKVEQNALLDPHLRRLIKKGYEGDERVRAEMLELGAQLGGSRFQLLLAERKTKGLRESTIEWLQGLMRHRRRKREWREWERRFGFRVESSVVDLGFGTAQAFGKLRLPIDLLRSPLLSHGGWRVLGLEETPHYAWIKDLAEGRDDTQSQRGYRRYIELFHPEENVADALSLVKNLVKAIHEAKVAGEPTYIAIHPPGSYRGQYCAVIYDGNHRACILKVLGETHVDCKVVDIEMRDDYFPANVFDLAESVDKREAREIDAWIERGKPARPPHSVKVRAIKDYARRFPVHKLVETGTYRGDLVAACRNAFQSVVSIELSPTLFENACLRFASDAGIKILQGDSSELLPQVLAETHEPTLFWLDAHYSGGITAKGAESTPIHRELETILAHPTQGHVILIDDAGDFIGEDGYPTIAQLREFVRARRPDYRFEVADDIIRIHA